MQPNAQQPIEVALSPGKSLGLTATSFGIVALGVAMATMAKDEPLIVFIGWASIVTFGFFGLVGLRQFMTLKGPVLTLTSEGLTDRRVSDAMIPWEKVERIFTWSSSGQNVMVLKLDPAFDAAFPTKLITRWTRGANRKLGADGIAVTATGLRIGHDEMIEAAIRLAEARHRDR